MRIKSLVGLAVIAPLLIATAQPVRLQPSSPWVLDYAENSCRLMRTFGEGSDKMQLLFESDAPGEMDLVVVGRPLHGDSEEVPATFLPLESKPMKGRRAKTVGAGDPGVFWPEFLLLPQAEAEQVEKQEKEREAHPSVRLLVDASGKVTKCTSLSHFEAPEFNQIVCDTFMKRAHFEPAETADGAKVPSYYTKRIRFQIAG